MQNLFIGKGNLGDSPKLKHVTGRNGDFTVASMRVMFGRYRQNQEGVVEQVGGFWREVEIYGAKAEACAKHLRKAKLLRWGGASAIFATAIGLAVLPVRSMRQNQAR